MGIALAVPLSLAQIDAANTLHEQLLQWQVTDKAFLMLHERFPDLDIESTLLKVAAVNQLYGTNVYAVDRMATHIIEVLQQQDHLDDVDLVEKIASLYNSKRKHISFASKFAHFFIDKERFPIYDRFAIDMVKFHLGQQVKVKDKEQPYRLFCQKLAILKELVSTQGLCTYESLDRYLWLTGLYKEYKTKAKPKINREVEALFKALLIDDVPTSLLQAMLPAEFARLVRRKPHAVLETSR